MKLIWNFVFVSVEATNSIDQKMPDMQQHANTDDISLILKMIKSHGAKKRLSTTYKKTRSKPAASKINYG